MFHRLAIWRPKGRVPNLGQPLFASGVAGCCRCATASLCARGSCPRRRPDLRSPRCEHDIWTTWRRDAHRTGSRAGAVVSDPDYTGIGEEKTRTRRRPLVRAWDMRLPALPCVYAKKSSRILRLPGSGGAARAPLPCLLSGLPPLRSLRTESRPCRRREPLTS